jgi:hypothetical protein
MLAIKAVTTRVLTAIAVTARLIRVAAADFTLPAHAFLALSSIAAIKAPTTAGPIWVTATGLTLTIFVRPFALRHIAAVSFPTAPLARPAAANLALAIHTFLT